METSIGHEAVQAWIHVSCDGGESHGLVQNPTTKHLDADEGVSIQPFDLDRDPVLAPACALKAPMIYRNIRTISRVFWPIGYRKSCRVCCTLRGVARVSYEGYCSDDQHDTVCIYIY